MHVQRLEARSRVEKDLAFLLLQLLDQNCQDHVSVRLIPLVPAPPTVAREITSALSPSEEGAGTLKAAVSHRMFLSAAGDPVGRRGAAAGAAACSGSGSVGNT